MEELQLEAAAGGKTAAAAAAEEEEEEEKAAAAEEEEEEGEEEESKEEEEEEEDEVIRCVRNKLDPLFGEADAEFDGMPLGSSSPGWVGVSSFCFASILKLQTHTEYACSAAARRGVLFF